MDLFTPIRRRLAAWNVLILGLLLVLVSALMYVTLEHLLLSTVDQNLGARGTQAAADRHDVAQDAVRSDEGGYQDGLFYLIAAPTGTILTNLQAVNVRTLPSSVLGSPAGGPHFATLTQGGEELRLYVHPLVQPPVPGAVLVVGQSLEPTEQTLHRLVVVLFLVGGAGLALAVAGGWFLAGRALVPIQQAYARQQAFVADASHELRTPLGILRVAADLLYERRRSARRTSLTASIVPTRRVPPAVPVWAWRLPSRWSRRTVARSRSRARWAKARR